MRESKKEKFMNEYFNGTNGTKYQNLKDKFRKSIMRLVVEKYKKTVSFIGLSPEEKAKFKADLYIYLLE